MPGKQNSFAKHAASYLREALKKAAKTYKHGIRPRKKIVQSLQARRNSLNAQIKKEKARGRQA